MPKVIKSSGRNVILKVKRSCEAERDNKGPVIPFSKVRARVAFLTGNFWGDHNYDMLLLCRVIFMLYVYLNLVRFRYI